MEIFAFLYLWLSSICGNNSIIPRFTTHSNDDNNKNENDDANKATKWFRLWYKQRLHTKMIHPKITWKSIVLTPKNHENIRNTNKMLSKSLWCGLTTAFVVYIENDMQFHYHNHKTFIFTKSSKFFTSSSAEWNFIIVRQNLFNSFNLLKYSTG